MIGTLFLFLVGLIIGWRRCVIDGKAVGGILAYGLFMTIVVVTANLSVKPWLGPPGLLMWLLALLIYVVPVCLGYAIGMAAKRQRLANDRDANGAE